MSENLFGLTVAADKGLDDLQCQRPVSYRHLKSEAIIGIGIIKPKRALADIFKPSAEDGFAFASAA